MSAKTLIEATPDEVSVQKSHTSFYYGTTLARMGLLPAQWTSCR